MKIGIVDIETTGFDPVKDFICEFGLVLLDSITGKIETIYDSCVKEEGMGWHIKTARIFKNSSMDINDVRKAPMLEDQREGIQNALNKCDVVTAYNKAFDTKFIYHRGFEIKREWDCPMLAATPVCKLPCKFGRHKWPSVEECWRFLFPDELYIEQHRGADDAYHEAKIVNELLKRGVMTLPEIEKEK